MVLTAVNSTYMIVHSPVLMIRIENSMDICVSLFSLLISRVNLSELVGQMLKLSDD